MSGAVRMHTAEDAARFVPEIQGLRAIAVLAVLFYHLWPAAVPGGFVGVDVFFVISGYLITALLLREFQATGTIALRRFYARRVLRLLPAASVVLLAVAACVSMLPPVRWHTTGIDVAASTLYVQNWWLAAQAVDYLASEHGASALQHFWSLSVEEQYYLAWPLLLLLAARLFRRAAVHGTALFTWIIGSVFVLSLAYSIAISSANPGLAYFATTTRAWELALGGLTAVWVCGRTHAVPGGAAWGLVGVVLIAAAVLAIDTSMPFPGYVALWPTLAAAIVIAVGARPGTLLRRVLGCAPMQYIGDLSYSLYLWHWPVIVLFREIAGGAPGIVEGIALAAISLALAHQTKTLVEDRFRFLPGLRAGWRPFAFGGTAMAACVLAAVLVWSGVYPSAPVARVEQEAVPEPTLAVPAAVAVSLDRIVPALAAAREDNPSVYAKNCHASPRSSKPTTCSWGPEDAPIHVLLAGDSHAAQWVPALEDIARRKGWRLTSLTKSACPFADGAVLQRNGDVYASCVSWNRAALALVLRLRPTLLVTSQAVMLKAHGTASGAASHAALSEGLASRWTTLLRAGIRVVALKDTPRMGVDVPECLGSRRGSIERCGRPRAQVLATPDPLVMAQRDTRGVSLIDLNDSLCPTAVCPPVLGEHLVWRDSHHMTATFATSLAPRLEAYLDAALAAPLPAPSQTETP